MRAGRPWLVLQLVLGWAALFPLGYGALCVVSPADIAPLSNTLSGAVAELDLIRVADPVWRRDYHLVARIDSSHHGVEDNRFASATDMDLVAVVG